jgi:TonB-linked SusC/RagA family outer membrane protein
MSYQLPVGFELKLSAGYNNLKLDENNITPAIFFKPGTLPDLTVARNYVRGTNQIRTWNVEPQINYSRKFSKHQFDALVAATLQSTNQSAIFIDARGYSSDALIENPAFATTKLNTANFSEYRYNAVFSRLGYNYDEKYVLNLTVRRDGSSRFGPANRYGNFGAIGAAWIFTNENFSKNNFSFLSLGKLRGSMGRTGNDQMGNYQYLSTYSSDFAAYSGNIGVLPNKLTNPDYEWETIDKMELALELGFLNNRIQANLNLFRNRTKNQLVGNPLPAITGFNIITANLPAVIQNKGLEIEISSTNLQSKKFIWNTSFNITVPRNKLVSFPNLAAHPTYSSRYIIGQPLSITYLWQYTGIDSNTGVYTFEDINHDGLLDLKNDQRALFNFYGGLNNTLSYKGFTLDFFFQFVKQTGWKYVSNQVGILPGAYLNTGNNQPVIVLDRWTKANDQAYYQKFNQDYSGIEAWDQFMYSNARIVNASFIRLKNVMIAYSLPSECIRSIGMQQVRIYAQAQNLLTITKYKHVDPEAPSGLPPLRTTTAGIQFTF